MQEFSYKAIALDGKSRQGVIEASSEAEAFSKLRSENLSPVTLKKKGQAQPKGQSKTIFSFWPRSKTLSELELEALLQGLAVLLKAGSDIRTALNVLGDDGPAKIMAQKILGGSSLDIAMGEVIPEAFSHLHGLIAAGEARGDLPSGLEGAAKVLETRRKIRQQLFEALSYPGFIMVTAVGALCVILLVVVPAIAPLLQDTGHALPLYFQVIMFLSQALQHGWAYLLTGVLLAGLGLYTGFKYGQLKSVFEVWLLSGPFGSLCRGLVFGGYAKTLGDSLQSGASLVDSLRLCQRSVGNSAARKRLDPVMTLIRQGRSLSEAFRHVAGFPKPIIKLCEVGEASSALGAMLAKAGEREEAAALSRIDKLAKLLGPILIMALGALIGGLMAGVLTALTDIGSVSGV